MLTRAQGHGFAAARQGLTDWASNRLPHYADAERSAVRTVREEVLRQWKEEMDRRIEECFRSLEDREYPCHSQFSYSFVHNDWSRRVTRPAVLAFVEGEGVDRGGLADNVEAYDKADRLFMHYGFPYFCTYDKTMFAGYDRA